MFSFCIFLVDMKLTYITYVINCNATLHLIIKNHGSLSSMKLNQLPVKFFVLFFSNYCVLWITLFATILLPTISLYFNNNALRQILLFYIIHKLILIIGAPVTVSYLHCFWNFIRFISSLYIRQLLNLFHI